MSYPKVTIVGAGQVGATTAELLLLHEIADVVLVDVVEGLPQGKALDLMHMRSIEWFGTSIVGTNDYADTAGSDVVVITAGMPRKPGMSRDDLLAANRAIVEAVVPPVVKASPDAILLCVTNPLDVMTYLAWKLSGFAPARVIGMGGLLDSARFAFAIAEKTGVPIHDIEALVIGAHGDGMIPMPRFSRVGNATLDRLLPADEVDALVQRTINGGAEVVGLLKSGSAFYGPAASVARMVHAIVNDTREALPACVYLNGKYGIKDTFVNVPATLGSAGVMGIEEAPINQEELAALQTSAAMISKAVDSLGLRD